MDIPTIIKEVFSLFFTLSVLECIVLQCNKYAVECIGDKFSTWLKISVEELLAYMGFMVLMGIVRLPAIRDYWKKSDAYYYAPVTGRITRN